MPSPDDVVRAMVACWNVPDPDPGRRDYFDMAEVNRALGH